VGSGQVMALLAWLDALETAWLLPVPLAAPEEDEVDPPAVLLASCTWLLVVPAPLDELAEVELSVVLVQAAADTARIREERTRKDVRMRTGLGPAERVFNQPNGPAAHAGAQAPLPHCVTSRWTPGGARPTLTP